MSKITTDDFLNILTILKDLSNITNYSIEEIINKIQRLTEEEIREILKIENPYHKEIKIYIHLKNKELPSEAKSVLNQNIKNNNYKINNILVIIEKLIKEDKKFEIVKYINAISNATSIDSASYAESIVLEPKTDSVENRAEFVEVVANSNSRIKAEYGSMASKNENILSHKDALEIVKTLVNAKEGYQTLYTYHVARRKEVLKRNDALCIIKSIASAKYIYEAEYIYNLIRNEELIIREELLELIASIKKANTKEEIKEIYIEILTKYTKNTPILVKRRTKA